MSDSMLYKLFDKKTSGSGVKSEIISNQELATELQKPVIRKFENRKVQSSFMDNIWGADLADMLLINLIKDFVPYYVFLIFSVYTHALFVSKIRKILQLLMLFKISQMNLIANKRQYRQIKGANFTIDQ